MVVSLVNPHDVLLYPKTYESGGYDPAWLEGEIGLPATVDEDLSTKPTVQAEFLRLFNASGPIPTPQMKLNYLNFYGNLMKASDEYLVKILDMLEARGLLETRSSSRRPTTGRWAPPTAACARRTSTSTRKQPRPAGLLKSTPVPQARVVFLDCLARRLSAHPRWPPRHQRKKMLSSGTERLSR